jgi:hypothetical protein
MGPARFAAIIRKTSNELTIQYWKAALIRFTILPGQWGRTGKPRGFPGQKARHASFSILTLQI